MPIHEILICLLVGYAFGNIPNGYLYAKAHGIDIYKEGSGNPGSTNILRTLGKKGRNHRASHGYCEMYVAHLLYGTLL